MTKDARIPPVDLDAERSLLSVILLDAAAIEGPKVNTLAPDDFSRPDHKEAFDAMLALYGRGAPIDAVTLADELRKRGVVEDPKALAMEIQGEEPGRLNAEYYADIVLGHAANRAVIAAATHAMNIAYNGGDTGRAIAALHDGAAALGARLVATRPRLKLVTVNLSTIQPQRVTWVWKGRVARGKLNMLDGLPDMGKSTISMDIGGRVTNGALMPDGTPGLGAPANVIAFTAEDGLADTVRPRLDAVGGDSARIEVVTASEIIDDKGRKGKAWPDLKRDLELLREAVLDYDARLVIVDVLLSYIDVRISSYNDQHVRSVLGPLAQMAEETDCAIICLRHPTKAGSRDPILTGGGSIGIIGAARIGLLAGWHPEDDELPDNEKRRVLAVSKCNIGQKADTMIYRIMGAPDSEAGLVKWEGTSPLRANDLTSDPGERGEVASGSGAQRYLVSLFAERTAIPAADANALMEAAGYTAKQIRTAREKLRIESRRDGWAGPVDWYLPTGRGAIDAP